MKTVYTCFESPVGQLTLTSDGESLTGLYMDAHKIGGFTTAGMLQDDDSPVLVAARDQLRGYFGGKLTQFDLPLAPVGTDFQRRVWDELLRIGYGETLSYGELARRLGNPNASRAVGLANGRNPISIVIPCHRVIGANGKLVGYGGGIDRKAVLLDFEREVRAGGPQVMEPRLENLFASPALRT